MATDGDVSNQGLGLAPPRGVSSSSGGSIPSDEDGPQLWGPAAGPRGVRPPGRALVPLLHVLPA